MKNKELIVKTKNADYQINFGQIQLEITGRCNMSCQHCRAVNELKYDVPVSQIKKVMEFAGMFRKDRNEVVISGGEPLMHKDFENVLKCIREAGGEIAIMTTNGSIVRKKHIDLIKSLSFKRFIFSVSLDSLKPETHDKFRGYAGAYDSAIKAIRLISEHKPEKISLSLRVTILPGQINSMDEFAEFALRNGCDMVSFSAVYPIGRAKHNMSLWMKGDEKKIFLEKIKELMTKYQKKSFIVSTNDPLKNLIGGCTKFDSDEKSEKLVLSGCVAGSATFNLCSNGDLTPCALLEMPIMNIFKLTIPQIIRNYERSKIIKNLLCSELSLKGKCSKCEMKEICRGGCRARAFGKTNDYLAEDPECWM